MRNFKDDTCVSYSSFSSGGRLVVDAALEASRGPVNELDRALRLDRRDRRVDILRDNIPTVP